MVTTTTQRISWSDLRLRAQALRQRAAAAGEAGLSLRVTDILESLPLPYDPEPLPDDASDEEIAEAEREPLDFAEDVLKRHGVRCRPTPADVGIDGVIVLRPSNRFALQGAITIGVFALIAGIVTSKIAFAIFVPTVAIGAWLTWRQISHLDRYVPRVVPRGRIFGALLMLILLAIASIVVVQPARSWARERGQTRDATALAAQANAQVDAGDIASARGSIDAALRLSPELGDVQVVSDKVLAAQITMQVTAQTNAQFAAQAAYQRAEFEQKAGNWDIAIAQMTALGGFADAPQRLLLYRNEAALLTVGRAKRALAAGDPQKAFKLASKAATYDPAARDKQLMKRIYLALTAGS